MKSLFAPLRRVLLVLVCLLLLGQVFLASTGKSKLNEFPVAVVLGRYDLFLDRHWTVYNETVGDLRSHGFDLGGNVNNVVQSNYTYLNYTLKSKIVGLSWPNVTLQVKQGTYDLNLTVYKVMTDGTIGERAATFLAPNPQAVINPESSYTDPYFGVGVDPSVLTIGNTFNVSAQVYTVNRTETLKDTVWGQNDTYICASQFANATYFYSWTLWCDATSGLFLKSVIESKTPSFTSYEEQEIIETGVENNAYDVSQNGKLYQVLVNTNSRLDGFEYDSKAKAMRLTVDGPEGTFGICNLTIPRSLVSAGNGLEVYVDGHKANHTLTEDTNDYFVSIGYQHSEHIITVSIVGSNLLAEPLVWAVAIVIIALLAGAVYYLRKTHHRRHQKTHS